MRLHWLCGYTGCYTGYQFGNTRLLSGFNVFTMVTNVMWLHWFPMWLLECSLLVTNVVSLLPMRLHWLPKWQHWYQCGSTLVVTLQGTNVIDYQCGYTGYQCGFIGHLNVVSLVTNVVSLLTMRVHWLPKWQHWYQCGSSLVVTLQGTNVIDYQCGIHWLPLPTYVYQKNTHFRYLQRHLQCASASHSG